MGGSRIFGRGGGGEDAPEWLLPTLTMLVCHNVYR